MPLVFQMPATFNTKSYDAVAGLGARVNSQAWRGFTNGWHAVAYRFRGADEASTRFSQSMARASLDNSERYEQEEALFSFCFNALSALECFYFAAYHLGAMTQQHGVRRAPTGAQPTTSPITGHLQPGLPWCPVVTGAFDQAAAPP